MVSTVVRESLTLYRRLFWPLVLTSFAIFLPFAIALLVLQLLVPDTSNSRQGIAILDAVGSLLLFAPLAVIVIIRSAIAFEQTGAASPRRELGAAFGMLVEYVLTQVMVLIVIAAIPGALIALGYASDSPTLMTIGAGVLIGSALFNGVRLTVATIAVAVGDARYGPALRRSAALTHGNWLRTFGVIAIISLIALAIAALLTSFSLGFPDGAPRNIAGALIGVIANSVTVPLIALGSYRLYRALMAQASARRAA